MVGKMLDKKDANFGYNAATDKFEDLVKAGVIDPVKVVRTALQTQPRSPVADHDRSDGRREAAAKLPALCLRCPIWAAWAAWAA